MNQYVEWSFEMPLKFKGGPSDPGTKILQKNLKNHPYPPKAF